MRKAPIRKGAPQFGINRSLSSSSEEEIAEVKEFCAKLGVDLAKIEAAEPKTFERVQGIEDAVR